jgi:hypothetical protein
MKTVIQVWTHNCCNMPQTDHSNYWGIGDVLRGTIQLFLLSKKLGFNYYVDFSLHPISQHLMPTENPFAELIQQNRYSIYMVPAHCSVEMHINSLSEGVHHFFTNAHITEPLDYTTKAFLKQILRPNKSMQEAITKSSQLRPYEVMHFRLGDTELVNGQNNTSRYTSMQILDLIKKNLSDNDILISDSMSLKMNQEVQNEVYVLQTTPVHLGRATDPESIKDTLVDFFLLTGATRIKTYSCYEWTSGFVYWAHQIYDVPLIKMNGLDEQ